MSTKSSESVSWIDRSEQRFQSSAGAFRKKTENTYVCTLWSSLQIFGSDSKLFHLDQESEKLEI